MFINTEKIWDEVSEAFNTYKEDIYIGVRDNMVTDWPVVLDYVKENNIGPKAVDFGCGTGMFCKELKNLGFEVCGVDSSEKMIEIAKRHLGQEIQYFVGDTKKVQELSEKNGKFNLITAIMVFQFLPEPEESIKVLGDSIAPNGHIVFTVHNPEHLERRGVEDEFKVGGTEKAVPIFKRTAEDYDKIFKNLGFKKTLEKYPSISDEIIKKYKLNYPTDVAKHMSLAYQKI